MRVVYSDRHKFHNPQYEVYKGGKSLHRDLPERVENILTELRSAGVYDISESQEFGLDDIGKVHATDYISYLRQSFEENNTEAGQKPLSDVYPSVFPLGRQSCISANSIAKQGYYCFDTYTPITKHTFEAALHSAYCALTGVSFLLDGDHVVYALCRPPGHHADRGICGGYCYFNNAAIAAAKLKDYGKVAIIDIDYHHGNGTQNIFYDTDKVLFVSIHRHPDKAFPYFWGFPHETGEGSGKGYNHNFALSADVADDVYLSVLQQAIQAVRVYAPEFLIVSAGFDTYLDDPVGDFKLTTRSYNAMGSELAGVNVPTLIVQEGGYNNEKLGKIVRNFLQGWST